VSAEQAEQAELPSARSLLRWLDSWIHAPLDPHLAAIIRIGCGFLMFLNFFAALPHVEMWWSEHGFLPYAPSKFVIDSNTWTLFDWLPHTDTVLWTCWTLVCVQAALLTLGVAGRFQAACLFVWAITFNHRNGLIIDGEDIVFRLMMFFMAFMPASDVWSVKAWINKKRGKTEIPERDGWALRLMQIQICIVLWSAGMEKLNGGMWWGGTAMYYVMHLDDFFGHLPVPDFVRSNLLFSRLLTWASLWIEVGGPMLIWFKETRRFALLAILGLHFGIEYMMNLYLFQWIMLVGWLSHANRSDLVWIKSLWARVFKRSERTEPTAAAANAATSTRVSKTSSSVGKAK
jgi:hypothetical protein